MKLYVNTTKQPPTLSESLSAKTDAEGVLQVYNSSFGSSLSALRFKRGSTVPFDFIFPDAAAAADVAKLRFGVKLAGKFDDMLVCAAETTAQTTLADGSVKFSLKIKFDATAIDSALNVDSATDNDLASANFTAELEWENAAGEITSTETVTAAICNNILRGTTSASGATFGTWTSLMVIKMSWAEYSALSEKNLEALYIVPDAPDELAEHDADANAHAELIEELRERITTAQTSADSDAADMVADLRAEFVDTLDNATATISNQASTILNAHASAKATTTTVSHVRLAAALTDNGDVAVPRAALVKSALDAKADVSALDAKADVSALDAKADALTGVLTYPALVDATLGERARVLHGEIQGDINAHGWKCTTEDLGAEAGATIVPTEISFYRRSADTNSDSTVPRYLRILRASADGTAWQIAYQSTNGLAPNSFTAGTAMTWKMRNVDGRGAIPAGETILLTQTDTPQSIATANVRWGAKNTTTAHGVIVVSSVIPSDPNGTVSTSTYSPAADMTYYKVASLADALSAKADATATKLRYTMIELELKEKATKTALNDATANIATNATDIAELQTALAELTARVSALENA